MNASNLYKALGDKMYAAWGKAKKRDRLARQAERRANKAYDEKRYAAGRRAYATMRKHSEASLGQTVAMNIISRERMFWHSQWLKSLGIEEN